MKQTVVTLVLGLILVGCQESGFKENVTLFDGTVVTTKTLNLGKQVYTEYCMGCHGVDGNGNGIAAKGSVPPPRNFTQGLYKFGLVKDGGLPTDKDFHRIIKYGLRGTAMLPWDISDNQIHAVTQYIKTFAPQVWLNKDETSAGEVIEVTEDPYKLARREFAIQKGKEVYHAVANCQTCHRAYVSKPELTKIYKKVNDEDLEEDDFEEGLYELKNQVSEYYFYDSKERFAKFLPPDFTWHDLRSVTSVEDIYKRLVAGVTGAGMPSWRGTIEDDEIWAVAYYVKSLVEMKETSARAALMTKIERENSAYTAGKAISKSEKVVAR